MGKGLKAALKSQQSRLRTKEKLQLAAHAAGLKGKAHARNSRSKSKGKEKPHNKLLPNQRPTIPFQPTDKILLIGEGNFSFARALAINPPSALDNLPPKNITATAYDTEVECYGKYPEAKEIVNNLRDAGVEVAFGVDATKLDKAPGFQGRKWDRIVWNFPHAGNGITDQDRNILSNQVLILDFLRSASKFLRTGGIPAVHNPKKKRLSEDDEDEDAETNDLDDSPLTNDSASKRGTVLITLRNVAPYTLWDVPGLAKKPPQPKSANKPPNPHYLQLRSFVFHRDLWTGYEHRMTKGERVHGTGRTGEGGEDRTWEFCLRD